MVDSAERKETGRLRAYDAGRFPVAVEKLHAIVARRGFVGPRRGASSPSIVRYLIRVVTHAAVVCVLVVFIAFFLVRAVPGDPVVSIQGLSSTPEARAAARVGCRILKWI